jgi:hypothetical protein
VHRTVDEVVAAFRGRIPDEKFALIEEYAEVNEPGEALTNLAWVAEALPDGSVTEEERRCIYELLAGTPDESDLPPSYASLGQTKID